MASGLWVARNVTVSSTRRHRWGFLYICICDRGEGVRHDTCCQNRIPLTRTAPREQPLQKHLAPPKNHVRPVLTGGPSSFIQHRRTEGQTRMMIRNRSKVGSSWERST